ncbi:phytanoyl-CoA dioxygenase family protein [Flavobacterium sp. F372]|uniref:Phytanoyl-CoA dioxygenase family protein n=1 Tax=Flavobacterium bernardetii TaxID=2813823 RepID=A0ABR7IXH4_9FLAO|nr:phytanoyl-CoA dioxygenase family protein [Flavobacterium bernardetii]MBC5834486.1 phytanoyl-CoA dioxygenase family protein [Flavobacterium bernardetii]NHF69875.1 phytanoyl-CoA dioxygenase family protein [Flavobacterium bernardetii]
MATNQLLVSFRNRALGDKKETQTTTSWTEEIEYLYKSGVGIDEALKYLYFEKPSVEAFESWVNQKQTFFVPSVAQEALVFSEEELQFFKTNGYVVLPNAIPKTDCLATQQIIWEFLEMHPDQSDTWYKNHPEQRGMMLNFFDHPLLEKNRASSKIRKAFEQLYQSENIYKTIDKVSFNPPITPNYSFKGSDLHWDVSLQLPIPFRLQGLIYLSDCGLKDGAFHCVPGFHNQITAWMQQVPEGVHPRAHALETLVPQAIKAYAGDMVIWQQALPHCATPNYGTSPRMVQYLSYISETYEEAKVWI